MTDVAFSRLVVDVMADGRTYWLDADFHVRYGRDLLRIPAGFETDFASVPRALWVIFPPAGLYSRAAVFHDWLYQFGAMSRADADRAFLVAMTALGVPWWQREAMYYGVRIGGWLAWRKYKKQREFLESLDARD